MDQLVPYTPWRTYYPDVKSPFLGGDPLLQQLPWRHWMQQEQPEKVSRLLLDFIRDAR